MSTEKKKTDREKKNYEEGGKSRKEILLCWFLIFAVAVFISNIFMHIMIYESSQGVKGEFKIRESYGYEVDGDQYTPITGDPQIYLETDQFREIAGIMMEFSEPIEESMLVEVYYPDEEGSYVQERCIYETVEAGKDDCYIAIPEGRYNHGMRIDVNGTVRIKGIYNGSKSQFIMYISRKIRCVVWMLCALFAIFVCACVYKISILKNKWEAICENIRGKIYGYYDAAQMKAILKRAAKMFLTGGAIVGIFAVVASQRGKDYNFSEILILVLICVLLCSFIWFRDFYRKRIETAFLIVFLCTGMVYVCVMPAMVGMSWDEHIHYNRAVSLARAAGGNITEADYYLTANLWSGSCEEEYQKTFKTQCQELYENGLYMLTADQYSFSYKDISYLPYIIGFWISYGLCLPFSATVVFTKFFHLLVIGILLYLSMKRLKSGKALVMIFAMIPTVFFLIASYDYDSWLTFLMLYAFCRYFGELQRKDEPLTLAGFLGIFIPAFLALIPKFVYAPMLFLMAYMPKKKFKEKKWCMAYRGCFVLAAMVAAAAILYFVSGKFTWGAEDLRGGDTVNANMQIQYILANSATYMTTLRNFLREYFSYASSSSYLTFMAYMGNTNIPYIPLALLMLAALFDREISDTKTIPVISKIGAVLMVPIIGAICATAMYITFTPVGLDTINGCQSRYLLPAIFPSLYMVTRIGVLAGYKKKMPMEIVNMGFIFVSICFLMYNLWVNCASKI